MDARLHKVKATPLFIAAERGDEAMVALLLRHGASTAGRNWNGVSALHVAALAGQLDVVRVAMNSVQAAPHSPL